MPEGNAVPDGRTEHDARLENVTTNRHPLTVSLPITASGARLSDGLLTKLAGRPLRLRVRFSALRPGRLDTRVTLGGVAVNGLALESVDVRAHGVSIRPGWPPRLRVETTEVGATVAQAAIDHWTHTVLLPVRLRLDDGGITARAGLAGLRLGEVALDLTVDSGRLRLVPRRVGVLGVGMANPSNGTPKLALPLPPLSRRARLTTLHHAAGEVQAWFTVDTFDEVLSPTAVTRLRRQISRLATLAPRAAGAVKVTTLPTGAAGASA